MVLNKYDIEAALHAEKQEISSGRLKEDNPLDVSDDFRSFCEACRRGDLKLCQENIQKGVNINARDRFDYTPLILASLCGHFEVVQLLLESGALCERDTFQGERCLYNALNDRIRNLLLSYDYSKSTDPLQPLAAHVTSLLTRDQPRTADIILHTHDADFHLHKFLLSARSPYFAKKLSAAPETTLWRLSEKVPTQSFQTCIRYLYFGEVAADLGDGEHEQEILTGIDKLSRQLEIDRLFESILGAGDRRLTRQRRAEEVERGREQLYEWFRENVLRHKVHIDSNKADDVRWDLNNGIFADVLLRADEPSYESSETATPTVQRTESVLNIIPVGHFQDTSQSPSRQRTPKRSVLFPCHRAMLLRSEVFAAMFSSPFREGQDSEYLQVVPVDCAPDVLEMVLTYLYTEKADFPLSIALDVLTAADMLFIEKLKQRAALLISTLGNGSASIVESVNPRGVTDLEDVINVYDVVRAGWDTRVHRLEEFGARYIAYRLERYIDEEEFAELVRESAGRIQARQETDTVELVDDIRYYLSERFRLRFEDAGLEDVMNESGTISSQNPSSDTSLSQDGQGADVRSGDTPPAHSFAPDSESLMEAGVVRTLGGDIAGDEFTQDALDYQILLGKIDRLMRNLELDA